MSILFPSEIEAPDLEFPIILLFIILRFSTFIALIPLDLLVMVFCEIVILEAFSITIPSVLVLLILKPLTTTGPAVESIVIIGLSFLEFNVEPTYEIKLKGLFITKYRLL